MAPVYGPVDVRPPEPVRQPSESGHDVLVAVWANVSAIVYGASISETARLGKARIEVSAREIVDRSPALVDVVGWGTGEGVRGAVPVTLKKTSILDGDEIKAVTAALRVLMPGLAEIADRMGLDLEAGARLSVDGSEVTAQSECDRHSLVAARGALRGKCEGSAVGYSDGGGGMFPPGWLSAGTSCQPVGHWGTSG